MKTSNSRPTTLDGIRKNDLVFLRSVGTGDVGDVIRFLEETPDGIIVDISVSQKPQSVMWNQIVELELVSKAV